MTIHRKDVLRVIMRVVRDKVLDSDEISNRILKTAEKWLVS